jgi:hypothetical protein
MRATVTTFVLLAAALPGAGAQVVRGTVTERTSGQPLAGVLVSVANVPDSLQPGGIRHALTNARGEYSVTVRPGLIQVSAKRIGVARFTGQPVTIGASETRRLDITLEAFQSTLPEIAVTVTTLCIPRESEVRTIVALWDEARTALIASTVTQQQRLLSGWLSKHARSLDPRTLRIMEARQSVAEGVFDRPMRSLDGESLRREGYWYTEGDSIVFHAPDADALLSEAFRTGHCFELARSQRRGLMGISFRPRPGGPRGGITGTVWLDGSSFELRYIAFRYANLYTIPNNLNLGGEVHFQRHESGAWIVRRWFVRMPQFPEVVSMADARTGRRPTPRPEVYRIIEEGGGLFTPGLRTWEAPGTIIGTVVDSTGRGPMAGASVVLSGTPLSTTTNERGEFRFDSIPPGAYTLLASNADYAGLGLIAADEALTLNVGQTFRPRLRALPTRHIWGVLCGAAFDSTQAVLRVVTTHADSGGVVPKLPVWLRWSDPGRGLTGEDSARLATMNQVTAPVASALGGMETMTDEQGVVTFCGVPTKTPLELVMLRSDDDPARPETARFVRITSFVLNPGEVAGRTVAVRPPR